MNNLIISFHIKDYLPNRKQRSKIKLSYSDWEDITIGVPQGLILGPHLFSIFLCELFLEDYVLNIVYI